MYKLMVVEDETRLRDGLCNYYPWEELQFEIVAQLGDGIQALEYLEQHPVDAIFTDIMMPRMDGLALAKQVKEKYPQIIVVLLSGHAEFEYAKKALQYQVLDYVLKPVNAATITEVFTRVRLALDQYYQIERPKEDSYHEKIIAKVQRYVISNLASASLEQAACEVGLSAGYLSTLFKEVTGNTFSQYLLESRMRQAKQWLLQVDFLHYEIAEHLGYQNPKNFSRAFKQYYGISPSEYRRQDGRS